MLIGVEIIFVEFGHPIFAGSAQTCGLCLLSFWASEFGILFICYPKLLVYNTTLNRKMC